MIKESRAYKYCEWCLTDGNEKVGKYVKLQAKAWKEIADGHNPNAYISEKRFKKITKLLKIIMHPDLGVCMLDGLEDYAILLIYAVMCTCKTGSEARYYETAILEIARKNYKTFVSAVIFVLLMLTEPRFSRFFSVAPDKSLSSELKVALKKIIKSSPLLQTEGSEAFKVMRSEIRCTLTESEYTPLAYSEDRLDGKLANAFLADEAGAMDNYPIEAMRSSQITLDSSLGIVISTQYPNDNNGMIEEIDIAKKSLDGVDTTGARIFALLYEPDMELQKEEAWQKDDRVIYQANPVAVTNKKIFDKLVQKRAIAELYENKRENFLCKHCNIKYKGLGVEGFVDISKVRECVWIDDKDFWRGKPVWIGLDLSQTDDNTAVVMLTIVDGVVYAKAWGFIPEEKKDIKTKKERVDYDRLIRNGDCYECGEEVIDYSFVEHKILNLQQEYGVEIQQVGYDRYNAISTIQKLEAEGIECVEIKQHSSVLHPATKLLKEYILTKKFRYAANLMLEINFENARCTQDTNMNMYVNKKKSAGKVDMVVALINAMYLLQQSLLYDDGFVVQVG